MKNYENMALESLKKIDKLKNDLKEDLRKNENAKKQYEEELRDLNHLKSMNLAWSQGISGIGILLIFSELKTKINKDTLLIKIRDQSHELSEFGDLSQIARERYLILQEAREDGLKLTDEAKANLDKDLIGFLIEDYIEFKNENEIDKVIIDNHKEKYNNHKLNSYEVKKEIDHDDGFEYEDR